MRRYFEFATAALAVIIGLGVFTVEARAQYLITGNDEKQLYDEAGNAVLHPPGKDTVSIIDIHARANPRVVANLSDREFHYRTAD